VPPWSIVTFSSTVIFLSIAAAAAFGSAGTAEAVAAAASRQSVRIVALGGLGAADTAELGERALLGLRPARFESLHCKTSLFPLKKDRERAAQPPYRRCRGGKKKQQRLVRKQLAIAKERSQQVSAAQRVAAGRGDGR